MITDKIVGYLTKEELKKCKLVTGRKSKYTHAYMNKNIIQEGCAQAYFKCSDRPYDYGCDIINVTTGKHIRDAHILYLKKEVVWLNPKKELIDDGNRPV